MNRRMLSRLLVKLHIRKYPILEFNSFGKMTRQDNFDGSWVKCKYDDVGHMIYLENSHGYWMEREYDANGNRTYYENSYGYIELNRFNDDGDLITTKTSMDL